MAKAYIDTTILTNVLLNVGQTREKSKSALARYSETQLPEYAVKEFRAGPFAAFIWLHNELAQSHSYGSALKALQALFGSLKRNMPATAFQALVNAQNSIGHYTPAQLEKKYGAHAKLDNILCDEVRLSLRRKVLRAWAGRHSIASKPVLSLPCFDGKGPEFRRGIFELKRGGCPRHIDCSLRARMIKRPDHLIALRDAVMRQPQKPENARRLKALNNLVRVPKQHMNDTDCRRLGDAVFAFFAPRDTRILTTNPKDHRPLAAALGKGVDTP